MDIVMDISEYTLEDFKALNEDVLYKLARLHGLSAAGAPYKKEFLEAFMLNCVSQNDSKRKFVSTDLKNKGSELIQNLEGDRFVERAKAYREEARAAQEATHERKYTRAGGQTENAQSAALRDDRNGYVNAGTPAVKRLSAQEYVNESSAKAMLADGSGLEFKGFLDVNAKGYGFIRGSFQGNTADKDAFVDTLIIRSLNLRQGDYIEGVGCKQAEGKSAALQYIIKVNGNDAKHVLRRRPQFDNLVPVYPDEKLTLENSSGKTDIAIRCIDLVAPIGKGQRAMIVSPPKAGKTTLLKQIANSIVRNNPNVKVFVLLIDERPEEVTDMQRSINADVVYSTFDEIPEHHIAIAENLFECAKRHVESGRDVVIVLDSLTRLARAYNLTVDHSGRSLSGGLDPQALFQPKKLFGAARNIENGGSLTIIATALIETGSRLDEVIFEEFKGTGNMEVLLSRKLAERRIFPAIDMAKSSTRRDDLLLTAEEAEVIGAIRSALDGNNLDTMERFIAEISKTKNNGEFVERYLKRLQGLGKSRA